MRYRVAAKGQEVEYNFYTKEAAKEWAGHLNLTERLEGRSENWQARDRWTKELI